ncbi:hypothetical protein NDU88_008724 [Pleurodeles waltl]|uniref:Immunoglobulin domain-containing protein n=1 Tax=Pleurodeles waltl TaxID=8319 RepID=A0AAV7PQ03_PLEWA|nr:hypothetical protein NDU88_008724 [Pleurodeles waltl]
MLLGPAPPLLVSSALLFLCCCFEAGANDFIDQYPAFISVAEDAAVNITCVVRLPGNAKKMSLRRGVRGLLHLSTESGLVSSMDNEFAGRFQVFGTAMTMTITLRQLRKSDTDWYMCVGSKSDSYHVHGSGTVIIVTGDEGTEMSQQPCQPSEDWIWEKALLVIFALVILVLCTVIVFNKVEGIQSQQKCTTSTVYEVMTSSVRRNSTTRPHFKTVTDSIAMDSIAMDTRVHLMQPPMARY